MKIGAAAVAGATSPSDVHVMISWLTGVSVVHAQLMVSDSFSPNGVRAVVTPAGSVSTTVIAPEEFCEPTFVGTSV
jgi:hypothetical protein